MQFVNEERELMLGLFFRALRAIEHGFSVRREYVLKSGETVLGGPDHYARLSAAKHLREFMLAGRPISREGENERRRLTWDEIEELLKEHEAEQSSDAREP